MVYYLAINKGNTMYVYIWKDTQSIPFYVGLTKRIGRTNPRNNGGRNWLTRQKLQSVGAENVVVEFHTVASIIEGQELERKLIEQYGRLQTNTGTLTNLRVGGEGMHSPTAEHREKLRQAMLNPNHPSRSPEARAKQRERMNSPEVLVLFKGDANPAKKPEVRAKLKEKWKDEEYRAVQIAARTGVKKNFSDKNRTAHAERLKANSAMKGWSERNGKDPEFDAKRIEGIRAAQPKRAEKMRDPEALAQRKARLKATMNSPEYKAKRALQNTPEYRAKMSAAKKEYWAKRKSSQA
jgi:hypothetical protein